jgi:hypothetical protein
VSNWPWQQCGSYGRVSNWPSTHHTRSWSSSFHWRPPPTQCLWPASSPGKMKSQTAACPPPSRPRVGALSRSNSERQQAAMACEWTTHDCLRTLHSTQHSVSSHTTATQAASHHKSSTSISFLRYSLGSASRIFFQGRASPVGIACRGCAVVGTGCTASVLHPICPAQSVVATEGMAVCVVTSGR